MFVPGPTGQTAAGFAMRTTRSLRPGALRKGKKFLRMLATFAMKRKNDPAIPTAQVKSVTFLLFFLLDGTDFKIQSRSCLALMRTQRSAPKVADFFRGELVKKSTQDHPAKTWSRRGLEKRSAIVYPVQVSYFFPSVRYETLCLTRSLRIWKLDRVRVHRGVRKSWGFKGNTRVQGKRLHHELLPRCWDRKDHWKSLQQTHLPNYDCRYHFYSSGRASTGSKTSNKIQELRPVVWWSWFSWLASQ